MKHFALVALLGLVSINETAALERFYYHPEYVQQASSSSSSSSSSDDEADVQLGATATYEPTYEKPKDFPAYMNGFGGYKTYIRDTPDRFESEADDTLMRSMYYTYATEGKKDGLPTGHFWVTTADAKKAAEEVVATHLHLKDGELKKYIETEFPVYWKKYDVNDEGKIEVDRMPVFLKSVCGNAEACFGL